MTLSCRRLARSLALGASASCALWIFSLPLGHLDRFLFIFRALVPLQGQVLMRMLLAAGALRRQCAPEPPHVGGLCSTDDQLVAVELSQNTKIGAQGI